MDVRCDICGGLVPPSRALVYCAACTPRGSADNSEEVDSLRDEVNRLRYELREAKKIIHAYRSGEAGKTLDSTLEYLERK